VAQRRDELVLRPSIERRACNDRDVDVAASVDVATEGARAREIDPDQLVAEQAPRALDELGEVRG
jgi:hypothetical protein